MNWETHYQLHEDKDYPRLVKYCEGEVSRNPEDLYAQIRLGEAYLLNKQYQDAIRTMGKCHGLHPDIDEFSRLILDALFALGKTEEDYEWVQKPRIMTIGPAVLDVCYEYLRPKRKPRDVERLRNEFLSKGYLTFSSEDLLKALIDDDRFVVEIDRRPRWSLVRIRRKYESGAKG